MRILRSAIRLWKSEPFRPMLANTKFACDGNVSMPFNTEGMYRGYVVADREPVVRIYE